MKQARWETFPGTRTRDGLRQRCHFLSLISANGDLLFTTPGYLDTDDSNAQRAIGDIEAAVKSAAGRVVRVQRRRR